MATLPRLVSSLAGLSLLAIVVGASPKPVCAQTSDSAKTGGGSTQAASEKPSDTAVAPATKADTSATKSDSSTESSPGAGLHAALEEFKAPPPTGDGAFDRASESFPAFCKDWGRRLHDRELNNVENVKWEDKDGYKTGTYVAYSPIKTCACKRSTGGVPIGELTYQETEYYLAGRTVEEARHAQPKAVGITNTTEIFRWDHTRWDDGR